MIVKLANVRAAIFNNALFVAHPFKPGDEPKFKATFLIKKTDPQIKIIEAAILQTANEKWPGKGAAIIASIRGNPNKFCFQDGDNKTYDGYQGMMALTAGSIKRPLVQDVDKSILTAADGRPYSGCYVNCSVDIFGYVNSGNGISASLRGVRFHKDGDAFSGGAPADENELDSVSDFGEAAGAEGLL